MDKSINYIVGKLNQYLAIPSLSGKETAFLNHLKSDFSPHKNQEWFDVFHTDARGQQEPYFSFLRDMTKPVDYIFVVHTDRVPDKSSNGIEKPYTSSPLVGNDGTLKGQLDNAISIAILRWLHHEGHSMNILFTTKEEICQSWMQIRDVVHACWTSRDGNHSHWTHQGSPAIIVVDIDIMDSLDDFKDGKLTSSPKYANDRVLGSWFFGGKGLPTFFGKANVPRVDSKHWRISELGFLHRFLEVGGDLCGGVYLGLPLINYHTDDETTHISCIESMVAVLTEFLNYNR